MISSLTHLETLGVPGSSFLLSSPVRPLLTDAIEPKIEKTAAPHTKENGAKKSTLRLPSTSLSMSGSKKIRKDARGENMISESSKSAMSATLERFELLARGSPQVTSLS